MIINPYLVIPAGPPSALDLEADTLVLADNDPVGSWTDDSGSGNTLTQANAANKPTYKATAGPGGRPCVRFDGGDYLFKATTTITPSPITIFAVLKPSDGSPRTICSGDTNSAQYRTNSLKQDLLKAGVADIGSSTTSLSTVAFQQINMTWNGTTVTYRLSGANDGSATNAQTLTGNIRAVGVSIGVISELFLGDICMVRIYTSVLTGAQIATVEAEILARWGV